MASYNVFRIILIRPHPSCDGTQRRTTLLKLERTHHHRKIMEKWAYPFHKSFNLFVCFHLVWIFFFVCLLFCWAQKFWDTITSNSHNRHDAGGVGKVRNRNLFVFAKTITLARNRFDLAQKDSPGCYFNHLLLRSSGHHLTGCNVNFDDQTKSDEQEINN